MDRGDRFFFAANGAAAVANFIEGNLLIGMLCLALALWLMAKCFPRAA